MSHKTLNALQYLIHTNELAKSPHKLMNLAIENARQSTTSQTDFAQESTRLQIENIRKASPETAKTVAMQHASLDINQHLAAAGIEPSSLNRNQKSQLKWAALFIETHRPDASFPDILVNAKSNLEKSNRLGSENIDESILHSIAFKDGNSWGVEPEVTLLALSVAENPLATKNMNALVDANDAYLVSQRNRSTIRSLIDDVSRGIKDATKTASKVATVGLVIGALALSAAQAVKVFDSGMDNIYSNSSTSLIIEAHGEMSLQDYSKLTLATMNLPSDEASVNKHLAASGYAPDDTVNTGDEVRLLIPEDTHDFHIINLSKRGTVERDGQEVDIIPGLSMPNDDGFVMTSIRG